MQTPRVLRNMTCPTMKCRVATMHVYWQASPESEKNAVAKPLAFGFPVVCAEFRLEEVVDGCTVRGHAAIEEVHQVAVI